MFYVSYYIRGIWRAKMRTFFSINARINRNINASMHFSTLSIINIMQYAMLYKIERKICGGIFCYVEICMKIHCFCHVWSAVSEWMWKYIKYISQFSVRFVSLSLKSIILPQWIENCVCVGMIRYFFSICMSPLLLLLLLLLLWRAHISQYLNQHAVISTITLSFSLKEIKICRFNSFHHSEKSWAQIYTILD